MALQLNLNKAAAGLRLNLEKRGVDPMRIQAQVVFDLDVSGSYRDEHERGQTSDLLTRLVPWGMVLDVNKEVDVFTFSHTPANVHHVGVVTPANVDGYVRREIIGRVPGWCGGTDYSYVIEKNLAHFGWIPNVEVKPGPEMKRGFFGNLFGGPKPTSTIVKPTATSNKQKALVLFNTDGDNGDNGDKERTYEVLKASQDRGDLAYFLFLAYANGGADFSFIEKLAADFSNVGICVIRNIPQFVNQPDDVLYNQLIGDEMLTWLKA